MSNTVDLSCEDLRSSLSIVLRAHQDGDIKLAESGYLRLIESTTPDSEIGLEVRHGYTILLAQTDRHEEAEPWAVALVADQPAPHHHHTLGNIYRHMGQYDAAMVQYQSAIELSPQYIVAMNGLGMVWYAKNHFPEAKSQFERVLLLQPDHPDARFHVALCAMQMKDWQLASDILRALTHSHPQYHPAWFAWSQAAFQLGDRDTAMHAIEQKLSMDPDHPDALCHQGVLLSESEAWQAAVHAFEQCVVQQPDHLEAQHNIASCYMRMAQPHRALQHYLFLAQRQPEPDVFYNIGTIYMHQEKHESALLYFHEALRLAPDDLKTHINLASVYLKTRQKDRAIKHYRHAQKLDPDNPEYDFILTALDQKQVPDHPPDAYVAHLFDAYAPVYEHHLVDCLQYTLHQHIRTMIMDLHLQEHPGIQALDVGCGTGLCAESLYDLCEAIDGVDLSEKMLAHARGRGHYRALHQGSYTDFLMSCQATYDWIIAADVLPYIGDPAPFIKLASAALKKHGVLIVSHELTDEANYTLQETLRYAHQPASMRALCVAHGFEVMRYEVVTARHQHQKPVKCGVWVCQQ